MSITVRHERADQRRHLWVHVPIPAEIDGVKHMAVAWGRSGLVVRETLLTPDQRVALRVTLPFQGYDVAFTTSGIVEPLADEDLTAESHRATPALPDDAVVIRFDALTNRDRDLIAHFVEDLVTGEMAPAQATLRRIDVPVEPTRLTTDAPATTQHKRARRPLRTVLAAATAAGIGGAALGYLGVLGYTSFAWQDVPVAVALSDATAAPAPVDGTVALGRFKVGDRVKAGDVLARIVDPKLEREIEVADLTVRERESRRYVVQAQPERLRRPDAQLRAREELRVAVARQRSLVDQRATLAVRAPFDGILSALPKADKATVRHGEAVAQVERTGERQVTALLTLAEADRLRVDARAIVRVPGDERVLTGRISEIVPLTQLIATSTPRAQSVLPNLPNRPLAARVTLDDAGASTSVPLQAGQPVIVLAERHGARQAMQAAQQMINGVKSTLASLGSRTEAVAAVAVATPKAIAHVDEKPRQKHESWLLRWLQP